MKKLIAIVCAICILISGLSVMAEPVRNDIIVGMYALKGNLYYCDVPTDRVVIKNVTAITQSVDARKVAREAEYLEISVSADGLRAKNGEKLKIDELNSFADGEVWFVIAKMADGFLAIPYLKIN